MAHIRYVLGVTVVGEEFFDGRWPFGMLLLYKKKAQAIQWFHGWFRFHVTVSSLWTPTKLQLTLGSQYLKQTWKINPISHRSVR